MEHYAILLLIGYLIKEAENFIILICYYFHLIAL